ncbi:DUF502 domain-containing protein [Desulfurispira natronophila]|uniref:Putative membrane protein n=1 Tax=Desulfurispira natronophila TaxID=682562 RepID=A0A7W7Y555_9BACT|nr:DUF502 domain-containing protein [Desulfurispira natronophila]MBB5022204.1 putative membrane protein [Desulfurispira natronophila]
MVIYRWLRQTCIAGLVVIFPAAVTLAFFHFLLDRIDRSFSPLVTHGLIQLGMDLSPHYRLPGLGIIAILVLLLGAGILTRYYLGRKILQITEWLFRRIPLAGSVYGAMHQLVHAFGGADRRAFRQVVLVEYPRAGVHAIGFLSAQVTGAVAAALPVSGETCFVFIPTTPNPTSGFLIAVPREQVTELPLSVEEGIALVISGGIVAPARG